MAAELTLVRPTRTLWQQQLNEPDWAFGYFSQWLLSNPRQQVANTEIANTYDWAKRALAFDNYQASLGRPKDRMHETFQNLLRLVSIESTHLMQRALQQPDGTNVLSSKELRDMVDLLCSYNELVTQTSGRTDQDLTKRSEVELRVLQAAHKIIKGA